MEFLELIAQIFFYIFALIVAYQILRAIFGGTWDTQDIVIALMILNLTATFTIVGYIIYLHTRISNVNMKLERYIGQQEGKNSLSNVKSKKSK